MRSVRAALCIFGAAHLVACGGQSENSSDTSSGGSNVGGAISPGGGDDSGGGGTSHGDAGSSNEGGATSPGGGGGTSGGGTSGGGTSGGGTSGDASVGAGGGSGSKVPACLTQLFASCELEGAYTVEDVNQDGSLLRYCYTSGVKMVSTRGAECGSGENKVYAGDGSLCYSLSRQGYAAHFCEGVVTTWKDSAGEPIATTTSPTSSPWTAQLTCAADGEGVWCPPKETCSWETLPGANCSVGACP